jgi:hypothetical protein
MASEGRTAVTWTVADSGGSDGDGWDGLDSKDGNTSDGDSGGAVSRGDGLMAAAMAMENVSRLTRNQELTEATRMTAWALVATKMAS